MPATSLPLAQFHQLLLSAHNLLFDNISRSHLPAALSRHNFAVDLSTHTLLYQHCALII
jgi:hypothetical protein